MIVYAVDTGASVEVESIDAREYVATGRWTATMPTPDAVPTEAQAVKDAEALMASAVSAGGQQGRRK